MGYFVKYMHYLFAGALLEISISMHYYWSSWSNV